MAEAAEMATVRVEGGLLRGRRMESRAGGALWSFQGVPYARPPLGPLRFKDAQPVEPWEGERDAFQEGDCCRQFDDTKNKYVGSEDCLFLNVYSPRAPPPQGRAADAPLPVVVFIHGGGFEFGDGNAEFYGPDYLVADGVILVTINYRLGVLGFLYLADASAPGNVGLKDQVAALRWVQRNVAAFGGDAGNVTLSGMSAGGASVHLHTVSPLSRGLFHRAIAMSGAALNPWAVQTEPERTARRLAQKLGLQDEGAPARAVVDFLRQVDYDALVRAAHEDVVPEVDRRRFITFSFVLTPELVVEGVEAFLPKPVEELMEEGAHHAVPYMTGFAEIESLLALAFVDFRKEDIAKEVDAHWEDRVLPELRLPLDETKRSAAVAELRSFFMGGNPLSKDTMGGFLDMLADLTFTEGITNALRYIAKKPKAPIYEYFFIVDDKLNFLKSLRAIDRKGACHADEVGYLFRTNFNDPDLPPDSVAALTRRRMVRMWTNFAKTGNPTPEDPLLDVQWPQYTDGERRYLEIGPQLRVKDNLLADRVAFWERFYSTYSSH